jgi:hypothetical protein
MNKFKQLYREFFGPTEAIKVTADQLKTNPKIKDLANNPAIDLELTNEELVDEAKLVNGIDEYLGGVEYAIKDPSIAKTVSDDIKQWALKKGFTIIKRTMSKNGKNGYFYFRLGEDPAKDAQRIQGYFAQRMELSAFRFKVRGEAKPKPQTRGQVNSKPQLSAAPTQTPPSNI